MQARPKPRPVRMVLKRPGSGPGPIIESKSSRTVPVAVKDAAVVRPVQPKPVALTVIRKRRSKSPHRVRRLAKMYEASKAVIDPVRFQYLRQFIMAQAPKWPLAHGIREALLPAAAEAGITPDELTVFMAISTGCRPYLEALTAPGAVRHGIGGKPGEPVTEKEKNFGLVRLDYLKKQRKLRSARSAA